MRYLECVKKVLREQEEGHFDAQETDTGIWERGKFNGKASLWITDQKTVAEKLQQKQQAVLILLTQHNKEEDFSAFLYATEGEEEPEEAYLERVYRRFLQIPWDILETKRCLLRETTVADVEDFYQIYKEPVMTEYMEDLYQDPEEERAYIRDYIKCQYGFYGYGVWTVIEKASGKIIGRVGLSHRSGYEEAELGFLIGVPWQRQGFATEICEAVLQYAKEELDMEVVQAFVMPKNIASIGVCKKLGMEERDLVTEQGGTVYRQYRKEL